MVFSPQPKSKAEIEIDLLKQEYFFLQTTIEDYNKQIWVLKGYLWDSLLISTVFVNYVLEIGFLLVLSLSKLF